MTCIGRQENIMKKFLEYRPSKNWGPKTTYCRLLRNSMTTLRANISTETIDTI